MSSISDDTYSITGYNANLAFGDLMDHNTRLAQFSTSFQQLADYLGRFGAIMLGFWVAVSTSGAGIAMVLMYIGFLLSGDWQKKLALLGKPILIFALLFYGWTALSSLYSPAEFHQQLTLLIKYSRILLVTWCLIYFLMDSKKTLIATLIAVALGCIVNIIAIYLNYFILSPAHAIQFSSPNWPAAQSHFQFAFFTLIFAFSCFITAFTTKIPKHIKYAFIAVGAIALIAEVGLNSARTGYVMEFASIILLYTMRFRLKGLLFAAIAASLLAGAAYYASPIFKARVNQTIISVRGYQKGNNTTSVGERLYFYQTSVNIIKSQPIIKTLFGNGNGSFEYTSKNFIDHHAHQYPKSFKLFAFKNPHNQFLLLLIENGIVGLGLFLTILLIFFKSAKEAAAPWRYIIYITGIGMVIGCLFNSWLRDFGPSIIFSTYLGILSAISAIKTRALSVSNSANKKSK